jgi:hypothetical protein
MPRSPKTIAIMNVDADEYKEITVVEGEGRQAMATLYSYNLLAAEKATLALIFKYLHERSHELANFDEKILYNQ